MVCILSQSFRNYRKYELNSDFFHFYFLNMNISVNIHPFDPKLSVCNPNILLEGSMSQNFDLGPTFDFMSKNGQLLMHFFCINFYIS